MRVPVSRVALRREEDVEEDEEDVVGDEYPYWMIFLIVDHIPSDEERDVGKDG